MVMEARERKASTMAGGVDALIVALVVLGLGAALVDPEGVRD